MKGFPIIINTGRLVHDTGTLFEKAGYVVKVFDAINFKKSMHYNPLHYIRHERDILQLTNAFILNTMGNDCHNRKNVWINAEKLFFGALLGYIQEELPPHERKFSILIRLMEIAGTNDKTLSSSDLNLLLQDLTQKKPDCFAAMQYKKFKRARDRTLSGILLSCSARLAPFTAPELKQLMDDDELELDLLGNRKTALYVMTDDTDPTSSGLAAILLSQIVQLIHDRTGTSTSASTGSGAAAHNGVMPPVPVRAMLDDIAKTGIIPDFDKSAAVRSRQGPVCVIPQSLSQLCDLYAKNKVNRIIDSGASFVFLGGTSPDTNKVLAEGISRSVLSSGHETKEPFRLYHFPVDMK